MSISVDKPVAPTAVIDSQAFTHNLKQIQQLIGHSQLLAVLKANAYGHGIHKIAALLPDDQAIAVARIQEGVALREQQCNNPIVVLGGFANLDQAKLAKLHGLTPVVHQLWQAQCLAEAQIAIPTWLKLETGMNRLGLSETEANHARQCLANIAPAQVVMTHFAYAADPTHAHNEQQWRHFHQMTHDWGMARSMAACALIYHPQYHADWVRVGRLLYGISPFSDQTGSQLSLQPVMTVYSRLLAIKHVSQGERIGYDGTYTAEKDLKIGVVAMGYADGYPSLAPSGTPVLVDGIQCPLVGRVSMDLLTVDLSHCSQATLESEVILWGKGLPLEIIAQHAKVSPLAILTTAGSRLQRTAIDSTSTHSGNAAVV